MKFWLPSVFLVLSFFLIFITPAYALSIEDISSWMSSIFRTTGYQVYETTTATATTETATASQPTSLIKEQVKCIFTDTDISQKCYGNDGKFGCAGIGSCIADVAGDAGMVVVWKSSCPDVGYVETTIDGSGMTKYVAFKCMSPQPAVQTATQTVTAATPVEIINEQVKCIFVNSDSVQRCGSSEGVGCSGVGSCVADISAGKGRVITWKSTCGGYAYTIMDSESEYAEFKCGQISTVTATPSETTIQVGTALPTSTPAQICTDSDGLNYYVKGYVETQYGGALVRKDYDTCRVINSNTDYYDTTDCSGQNCWVLEASCTSSQTAQAAVGRCPSNTCKDGACVKAEGEVLYGEGVREQIICKFLNSDVLINPHTAIPEKCYTDDGRFGCTWDGGVVTEESGKRYADCLVEVSGNRGQKLTWKSSCGGYAYTVIDGSHENAEFMCVPSSNVTTEQISGKGFRYAYLQCLDGQEQKILPPEGVLLCQPSEFYQQRATNFCKDHCNADGSKCGVNSFSISGECYIDVAQAGTVFIPSVEAAQAPQETQQAQPAQATAVKAEEATVICKDSCPLEGKCYPFGYRKEGKFCSEEGAFTDQLAGDTACENNFECSSNVCINSKCVSVSLMQKIIDFFRGLFGFK